MIAVDTNVVVRLLTGDDAKQMARSKNLFQSATIFIAKTVLLETDWVLRTLYGYDALRVVEALESLINLANVRVEDEPAVATALGYCRRGMDFADALHLVSGGQARQFATFDKDLIRRAARLGGLPVVSP